ncbi:hypothetical protein SNE40_019923 [Patella caerulea]|uniref:THAP-type domain-containing protein n=1 Tax=Patella caerulea TaxID=87958 RepID=A0AAN8J109_PATCE
MPATCCCFGCKNRHAHGSNVRFFRIPKDQYVQTKWIAAIRRENWTPNEHSRICSEHFIQGYPSKDPNSPDFIPSVFSFTPEVRKRKHGEDIERHSRYRARQENNGQAITALDVSNNNENRTNCPNSPGTSTQTEKKTLFDNSVQTDIHCSLLQNILYTNQYLKNSVDQKSFEIDDIKKQAYIDKQELKDNLVKLETQVQNLKDQNCQLIQKNSSQVLAFENFKDDDDDKKIQFYTGLPNISTFNAIFETIKNDSLPKKKGLSEQNELFLTLIRIKRNLTVSDLGYRFGVSPSFVTRVFHKWLDLMYIHLGGLVMWPESDVMELPDVFRNDRFKKTRCVIDCSEIFLESPTGLKPRAQTFSNYKRHNTVKFLVGISPTGAIIFLSKCYGGRASDKQITMESGFLDKLLPGDVVLADRGFTMVEEFAYRQAKLEFPHFTKGKTQLSAKEVEESRQLSRARIHVERVIGRMKDFEILQGTLPITMIKKPTDEGSVPSIDKIIHVIAAIINMNSPIL